MTIDLQSEIKRADGFLAAKVGDGQVLLDIDAGSYIGIDSVGSAIWERIAEPVTVVALRDALIDAYQGDPTVIEADLLAFVDRLAGMKMILCV
ncbi:PqqD family protein [Sphingomonas sp. So64.6b]|uniref:PqqD family protein n=1 Tax=Sphingomonas sp. So64.6b TaxID=2997354 RepID=UPI00160148C2|nr:PqqD family protein [Sphingomonas sp. So64.6b]QNA84450.1 PqqD family protein [Sphingomonas sp. So64.6b]